MTFMLISLVGIAIIDTMTNGVSLNPKVPNNHCKTTDQMPNTGKYEYNL